MEIRQGYNEGAPLVGGGVLVNDPGLAVLIYRRIFTRALAHHPMREPEILYFASLIVCLLEVDAKVEKTTFQAPVEK